MFKEHRRKAKGLPDLLNYCMMANEGIVLMKDGAFCAGWTYRGPDLNSSDNSDLAILSANVNTILCQLGDGWMVHTDMIRRTSVDYPRANESFFPDAVSRMIDEERRLQYQSEGAHYESTYFMIITYKPATDIQNKFRKLFITGQDKTELGWEKVLLLFEEKISLIENSLSRFLILERLNSNAMLTHLHTCITALNIPLRMPKIPVYLDTVLGTQDFIGGLYPKIGKYHIRTIGCTGFPLEIGPGFLRIMERLPLSLRWSNRFILLDPVTATNELKKYRRNWFQKRHGMMGILREVLSSQEGSGLQNRDALDMKEDAELAIQEAQSGLVRYGYYTSVIVLTSENLSEIEETTKILLKELESRGLVSHVETINAVEAYLGSLPGHGYQNLRRPLIHSLNLADILPLTSVWPGLENNPCPYFPPNSPPLMYAATEGSTTFRLNLHVNDVGHTAIFGPTGSGKSTLLATICAQFMRYKNAQLFWFDKGYSAYTLCKAMGGSHYDMMGEQKTLALYPLADIDQPAELNWACGYIEDCLESTGFKVNSYHRATLRSGLIRLSHTQSRTFTELQSAIQDTDLQQALEFFTLAGEMGGILDNDHDDLGEGRLQAFEMENLIEKGEARLKPVLLYLFHKIEKRLTSGFPTLIIVEEGHHFLKGRFGEELDTWFLELRKKNASVIFITQELEHVLASKHKHVLLNNTFTQIFLPNQRADNEINRPHYHGLGLSDKQIDIIKTAIPKKNYYVTSRLGNRLIDLGLGPLALSFVGVDGKVNRDKANELMERRG